MRNTFGFVAANCLDYTDNSAQSIDTSSNYDVAISAGVNGTYGTFRVIKLTPNPKYDPESFANNIAVVQFENGGRPDFVNYIASWRPDWEDLYFVRRTMFNVNTGGWNTPSVTSYSSNADTEGCARASAVFNSNQNDFLCNQLLVPSIYNSSCSVPFGSVYGVSSPNLAIAALYSHSAVYDSGSDGFCGNDKTYSYYTVMKNYMIWAMNVVGQRTPVFHAGSADYTEPTDPNYSMKIPSTADINIAGVSVYGGDIYTLKPKEVTIATPSVSITSSSISSSSSSSATASSSTSEPSLEPVIADKKSHRLSIAAIVALVVGASLALLLVVWIVVQRKRKGKASLMSRVHWWWFFGRHESKDKDNDNSYAMTQFNNRPPSYLADSGAWKLQRSWEPYGSSQNFESSR
ncbi:hypothetical protein LPJ73_001943 [Coemansia sp. RSA 2703]|nr:hypothetical protein LPJ73_001943 [Coemansia sp. RSA 2703]KAJ2376951.1 hypothetical protein IW150_001670 [Coemansia sp. RSA 2607]KAJ2395557.1 hypothetical protein GGI05_001527 [Coemansia sp. RSA 2603]